MLTICLFESVSDVTSPSPLYSFCVTCPRALVTLVGYALNSASHSVVVVLVRPSPVAGSVTHVTFPFESYPIVVVTHAFVVSSHSDLEVMVCPVQALIMSPSVIPPLVVVTLAIRPSIQFVVSGSWYVVVTVTVGRPSAYCAFTVGLP